MTLTRFNRTQDDFFPSLSRIFEEFMPNASTTAVPAVNVKETDTDFEVELAAPGLKKENFQISLDENVLTISSERQQIQQDEKAHYSRREFSYQSFARSFTLPEIVDQENIQARYEDGVLYLRLPKLNQEEVKKRRTITVG
ncbi:MAG: Hsp20/alpha crystallin family protein [Bernardetiaceae bacterium]